ncbi:hypothetical protein F4860DRAFT_198634 [Xylaria cubensis]|nr:hypothetical protein F4860DRAFT_198634 [Xylaria cubensis]
MASESTAESIADRVAKSLAAFEAIGRFGLQGELDASQSIWVHTITEKFSDFKLWADNIGAHRTGRSSSDDRLHTQKMRLLDDLTTSLNKMHSILSGETVPLDQTPGDASELNESKDLLKKEEVEFYSELDQLMKEITDAAINLRRLSKEEIPFLKKLRRKTVERDREYEHRLDPWLDEMGLIDILNRKKIAEPEHQNEEKEPSLQQQQQPQPPPQIRYEDSE